MARPKGSKNKTPEERAAAEAEKAKKAGGSSAGPGHNSAVLSENERTALFFQGITEIERLNRESASITGKIRDRRKKLAAINFEKDEVDFALNLRKNKETEETEKFRRRVAIAVMLSHPIGTQPDMIDVANRVEGVELAGKKGFTAGLEGLECKPPMDAGSPEGQRWMERWHEGNAQRTQTLKQVLDNAMAKPDGDAGKKAAEAFDDAMDEDEEENDAGAAGKPPEADAAQPTA